MAADLHEILETVMAMCAEYDMKDKKPDYQRENKKVAADLHSVLEPLKLRHMSSVLHMDWNSIMLWSMDEVMKTQQSTDQGWHNEQLSYELLNLMSLITLWIRENESRPGNNIKGRLQATTQAFISEQEKHR